MKPNQFPANPFEEERDLPPRPRHPEVTYGGRSMPFPAGLGNFGVHGWMGHDQSPIPAMARAEAPDAHPSIIVGGAHD